MNPSGNPRKLFKRWDLLVVGGLLLAAAVYFAASRLVVGRPGSYAEIRVYGKLVKTVDLSADAAFALDENPHVHFEVKGGKIAFVESDCPDKICIKSGFLGERGQMAACLPNGVTLTVVADDGGADAVAR